jgi:hypothetical protein
MVPPTILVALLAKPHLQSPGALVTGGLLVVTPDPDVHLMVQVKLGPFFLFPAKNLKLKVVETA